MKTMKILAVMLALVAIAWAQTATQATPSAPSQTTAPADKAKCACCEKMAAPDSKEEHASCMRQGKSMGDSKEMASCCAGKDESCCGGGKDANSCMKGDKTATFCSKEGYSKGKSASCCDRKAGKSCSTECCASNKSQKPA